MSKKLCLSTLQTLRKKFLYLSVFPLFCVTLWAEFPFQSVMNCKETQYETVIPNPAARAL